MAKGHRYVRAGGELDLKDYADFWLWFHYSLLIPEIKHVYQPDKRVLIYNYSVTRGTLDVPFIYF
jgi:hypothetical protein